MAELLASISSRELSEWMAYAEIEPFGELRQDYRIGTLVATTINMHLGKKHKPIQPGDVFAVPQPVLEDDIDEEDAAPEPTAVPLENWQRQKANVMLWHELICGQMKAN